MVELALPIYNVNRLKSLSDFCDGITDIEESQTFHLYSSWTTSNLESQGRLSIDSRGHKNLKIQAGLGRSKLEAKGGIVGGSIILDKLHNSRKLNYNVQMFEDG